MTATLHPTCALCGEVGSSTNPLVPDLFYEQLQMHLHCINSEDGRAWTQRQEASDPAFARYLDIATVGRAHRCAGCGSAERTAPKAYGMGAGIWEMNCTGCHRSRPALSVYHSAERRELVMRIQLLERDFRRGVRVDATLEQITALAAEHDQVLAPEPCACGGAFSLAASPRCSRCGTQLVQSPFNVSCGPSPDPVPPLPF
jgi:hypothetical protein